MNVVRWWRRQQNIVGDDRFKGTWNFNEELMGGGGGWGEGTMMLRHAGSADETRLTSDVDILTRSVMTGRRRSALIKLILDCCILRSSMSAASFYRKHLLSQRWFEELSYK